MSLQKEIESLLMWQDNIQGQDATYQQKASIAINKVLDAAVKAVTASCGNSDGSMYDYQAVNAINKMRDES